MALRDQASVVRAALPCLSYIIAALDPEDWPAASQPFTLLLRFCIDARPKVRRRAQSGLVDVLAALQRTAAIADASALVVKGAVIPQHPLGYWPTLGPPVGQPACTLPRCTSLSPCWLTRLMHNTVFGTQS